MTESIGEAIQRLTNEGHNTPPANNEEAARRLVEAFARRQKARRA